MAVAFDAVSNNLVTNTTSVTVALTIASNACLVATVQLKGAAGLSVSSVIANGVSMTQLARVESGGSSPLTNHLFVLTSAPSGTVSISANIVGAAHGMGIAAMSYTGQRTNGNPFSAIATLTAINVGVVNLSISTSTIDRCVLLGAGSTNLASNTTTRAVNTGNWGFLTGDTAGTINGASGFSCSVSMTTNANFVYSMILLNIAGVRATMDIRNFNRLMTGVGF